MKNVVIFARDLRVGDSILGTEVSVVTRIENDRVRFSTEIGMTFTVDGKALMDIQR